MTADILTNKHRPARVLLVEDNHGDVILTRRAFKEAEIETQLIVAMTGEDALKMLRREGDFVDTELPDIILLDLNLPQMSGKEVLKNIKEDSELRHIPVVILSSSRAEHDVLGSYGHHANGYLMKPKSLSQFGDVIKKLEAFWFTLVVLPDAEDLKKG